MDQGPGTLGLGLCKAHADLSSWINALPCSESESDKNASIGTGAGIKAGAGARGVLGAAQVRVTTPYLATPMQRAAFYMITEACAKHVQSRADSAGADSFEDAHDAACARASLAFSQFGFALPTLVRDNKCAGAALDEVLADMHAHMRRTQDDDVMLELVRRVRACEAAKAQELVGNLREETKTDAEAKAGAEAKERLEAARVLYEALDLDVDDASKRNCKPSNAIALATYDAFMAHAALVVGQPQRVDAHTVCQEFRAKSKSKGKSKQVRAKTQSKTRGTSTSKNTSKSKSKDSEDEDDDHDDEDGDSDCNGFYEYNKGGRGLDQGLDQGLGHSLGHTVVAFPWVHVL